MPGSIARSMLVRAMTLPTCGRPPAILICEAAVAVSSGRALSFLYAVGRSAGWSGSYIGHENGWEKTATAPSIVWWRYARCLEALRRGIKLRPKIHYAAWCVQYTAWNVLFQGAFHARV